MINDYIHVLAYCIIMSTKKLPPVHHMQESACASLFTKRVTRYAIGNVNEN